MIGIASRAAFLTARPIAHRGLHDRTEKRPENTLGAAGAAIAAGYGIECDVRLAADGEVVVFHDSTLERLAGQDGAVANRTAAALGATKVFDSEETVPLLTDLMSIAGGAVPLVIELKADGGGADELADAVAAIAKDHPGDLALMSFAHWQVRRLRELVPAIPVGLVAEGVQPRDLDLHRSIVGEIDFVSFKVDELDNPFCREVRESRLPLLCWTVKSADQAQWAYMRCDQITFEGFRP